jgi:Leucine-rich repeat (LRR) protein
MARKPTAKVALTQFATLLAKHLADGTRPAAVAGEPWTYAGFAEELPSSRKKDDYVSERSVSNWCKGKSLPTKIEPILEALFGPRNQESVRDRHGEARKTLSEAFRAARAKKNAVITARAKPDPAGGRWVAQNDQFAKDRTARATDERAAADPLRQQLQIKIHNFSIDLTDRAKRLANSQTWSGISTTAAAFGAVTNGDPLEVVEKLGDAYALLLRLGRFLETDIRIQRDPARSDEPLDPDIHGLLTDLVRTAAPWLRGFPTVAAWDDAAGKALVRADLFQPARDFIRIARQKQGISERDAAEVEVLADASAREGYQGQKAGTRAVGDAKNLMLVMAETFAAFLSESGASDFAKQSLLVQRAKATLAMAETQVGAFVATMPDDLRHALASLVKESKRLERSAVPSLQPPPRLPVPDDVEARAQAMIIEGRAPPSEWRPFIRNLQFSGTVVSDAAPLAGLTALQSLDLSGTEVSDVAPLAGLTALQSLDLSGIRVSDVAPLVGLTALQSLGLRGTKVSDVAPLAGLTALQSLDLSGIRVSDVAPLAGLTALQSLGLRGTKVSDVAPLAGLTALQSLDLNDTEVSDVAPLACLTALQSLGLRATEVSDVAPLAGLTALQSLNLNDTEVSDVAALAGLTALQKLHLNDTRVGDIAALAGLTALQSLNLSDTRVGDIAALAGLTALQSLDLSGTEVIDVAPLAGLTALQDLDLRATRVIDVAPLAGLTALHSLDLSDTDVIDVAPLAGLIALSHLDLRATWVIDVAPLAGLTALLIDRSGRYR